MMYSKKVWFIGKGEEGKGEINVTEGDLTWGGEPVTVENCNCGEL